MSSGGPLHCESCRRGDLLLEIIDLGQVGIGEKVVTLHEIIPNDNVTFLSLMSSYKFTSDPLPRSRQHYHLLDGLRGVAALMVVFYHIGEGWATSVEDQWWNHGYLAVDFFFVLSGFVIGYAYDGRWKGRQGGWMTTWDFYKRRLIRLHPLVILGTIFGVIGFAITGRHTWTGETTSWLWTLLAMLTTFFLIPAAPGSRLDVRGNNELYSLNGPFWSLLCEYVGNVLYALWLRRLSTRTLGAVVCITGALVAAYAIGNGSGHGHLGVGWTMSDYYLPAGLLVMSFCFSVGLWMSRVFRPAKIRGAFWWCGAVVVVVTGMPHFASLEQPWINGVYETVCILGLFPLIVWLGASGETTDRHSTRICNFCGDISYPLYAVHYPLMYIFYTWLWNNGITVAQGWPVAVCVVVGGIVLAWLSLKLYDVPVRRWLAGKFLQRRQE